MKCFHHNDLDGRCAGAIVAYYESNFNENDFFEVDYVQELPIDKIEKYERVYFVDYSFKKDTVWQLNKILEKTNDIIWIDHHLSSFELEKEFPWVQNIKGLRKNNISGAGLTYMYLYDCEYEDIPYYIKLVSDYDCWLYYYDPDTTYFKIGIDVYDCSPMSYIWKGLNYSNDFLQKIIDNGGIIKQYIDKTNEDYRNKFAYETKINGLKCLVVNQKTNSWIFGEKFDEYPIVMVWVFNGEKFIYSIFSDKDGVDCREIAEMYGGGGHKGAAGFMSDELLFHKKNF